MIRNDLVQFMHAQRWAVQASVAHHGQPQAAVIGIVVTDALEIFFDTDSNSRKAHNLRLNPKVALVIGWDEAQTVQCEGIVDEPRGEELARLKEAYFVKFPDGKDREQWPTIAYFRVKLSWLRYSDFRSTPPVIEAFDTASLR